LIEGKSVTEEQAVNISARLAQAEELWTHGELNDSRVVLEDALAEARSNPYQIKFRARIQLIAMLTSLYLAGQQTEKARELLTQEFALVEPIFQFIQMAGTIEQKRAATGDFMQLRELVTKVSLLGQPAPEIIIKEWINSAPLSLMDLRGRVVLLEFWATWCQQCEEVLPLLKRLNDEYAAQGLVVLALTRHYLAYPGMDEEQAKELQLIRNYVERQEISFPVGVAENERMQEEYGAGGLPALVLIDRQGIVRYSFGGGEEKHFTELLKQCLSESA
jgi:thiol-disulfide isomerase/thioredoxin